MIWDLIVILSALATDVASAQNVKLKSCLKLAKFTKAYLNVLPKP
jgi:hypothetical protein